MVDSTIMAAQMLRSSLSLSPRPSIILAQQSPGFYDDLLLIDSTPVECGRSWEIISPKKDKREVEPGLLGSCCREGRKILLADRGYAGQEFAGTIKQLEATVVRTQCKDEPGQYLFLAPIRQCIERILQRFSVLGRLHHPQLPTGVSPPGAGRLLWVGAGD